MSGNYQRGATTLTAEDSYEFPILLSRQRRGALVLPRGIDDQDLDLICRQIELAINTIIQCERCCASLLRNFKELETELAALRKVGPHVGTWQHITTEPTQRLLLLTGTSREGVVWRDVGVYQGIDETGRHFVDKYGAEAYPTHWMLLPEPPRTPEPDSPATAHVGYEPGERGRGVERDATYEEEE